MAEPAEPKSQATGGSRSEEVGAKKKPRLARRIFLSLCAGVFVGLFFGEYCAPFGVIAEAFIGLLEMTVLPYIVVALIANLARLTIGNGLKLVVTAAKVLLVLWGVGLLGIVLVPMALPQFDQGSFFSAAFVDEPTAVNFLELFIPTNVFFSLTSNLVPAIVLFCICIGMALISVKNKEAVVGPLDAIAEALHKVNGWVIALTPIGVFAIGAHTAGTMNIEELGKLQAYLFIYTVYIGIMTFGIVPLLIIATTPFSYREVMRALRAPMLTAFVTGKVLIVLPFLIESTKELFRTVQTDHQTTDRNSEVLYPLAYPFPHLGKLAGLIFIPFTAWFVGEALTLAKYPLFLIAGLFSYFGGPVLATPFLLDLMRLPQDMMQLFFASGVIAARMGDALGVMHFVALATITTAASVGLFSINWTRLVRGAVICGGVGLVCLVGIRVMLSATLVDDAGERDVLGEMTMILDPVEARDVAPGPNPTPIDPGEEPAHRVRSRNAMRVGLLPDRIPFSYRNVDGAWIGFDVEMAHQLARALDVELELMEVLPAQIEEALAQDWCDLVMGGLVETGPLTERVFLTKPYHFATAAGVVLDHRVSKLGDYGSLSARRDLVIAIDDPRYAAARDQYFPNAKTREVKDAAAFFDGSAKADLLITIAESAFPWTILHPGYQVINPFPRRFEVPLVYALNPRYPRFADYANRWIDRMSRSGIDAQLYDHWVLGKDARKRKPRWSIIRDVLGWIE